jgi:hypothetical protein
LFSHFPFSQETVVAMSDINDDFAGLDVNDEDIGIEIDQGIEDGDDETAATQWRLQHSWEERWKDVFKNLAGDSASCDEADNSRLLGLEDFKWKALVEKNTNLGMRPTVLHELAKDLNAGDFQAVPEQARLRVMNHLIDHDNSHTEQTQEYDQQEDPVLEVAIQNDNKDFLRYIVRNCEERLPKLLAARGPSGMNCLHYAVKHISKATKHSVLVRRKRAAEKRLDLKELLQLLQTFIEKAKAETATAQDKQNNTPIHYALDYELCRLPIDFYRQKIVRPLVFHGDATFKQNHARQFNTADESPYIYFKNTKEAWHKSHGTAAIPVAQAQSGSTTQHRPNNTMKSRDPRDSMFSVMTGNALLGDEKPGLEEGSRKSQMGRVHRTMENALLRKERQPMAQRGTADRAFDISDMQDAQLMHSGKGTPEVVPHMASQNTTSQTQAPKPAMATTSPPKTSAEEAADKIEDFLKIHYIRTRPDMEAKELLYGKFSLTLDKNMFFDATHEYGKTADEVVNLIEKLSRAGGFEDTLSYVNLPFLNHLTDSSNSPISKSYTSNERRSRLSDDKAQPVRPDGGRSSLISVFDKLSANKVHTILRLHVNDLNPPAHTDAAIERAIRGQDTFSLTVPRPLAINIETWCVVPIKSSSKLACFF